MHYASHVGKHGAADGVEHQVCKDTGGGVRLPDALPPLKVDYDFTLFTSFFLSDSHIKTKPENRFAHIDRYRKFQQEFDLHPKYSISPIRYRPGNQFKSGLHSSSALEGNSPPFKLKIDKFDDPAHVNFSVDQFGFNLFVTKIRYFGSFRIEDLRQLLQRQADLNKAIKKSATMMLLKRVSSMASGKPENMLSPLSKIRKHVHFSINSSSTNSEFQSEMARYISSNKRELVATHISGDHNQVPHPRLENALINHNSELNLKSESQLLLVNAQGSTLVSSAAENRSATYGSPYFNRHSRVIDLSEIATAMQHLLTQATQPDEIRSNDWAGDAYTIDRWIEYPSNVFLTSVSNQRVWDVISRAYSLTSLLQEVYDIDSRRLKEDQKTLAKAVTNPPIANRNGSHEY